MRREPKSEFGFTESAIYRRLVQPDAPKLLTTKGAMKTIVPTVSMNSFTHSMSLLESKGVLKRIGKGVYLNKSTGLRAEDSRYHPMGFQRYKILFGLERDGKSLEPFAADSILVSCHLRTEKRGSPQENHQLVFDA
jgi:hypothetical protein